MDRCPTCGLLLETTTTEGRSVQGCRECGGILFDAADLAALAKHQPQALGELERRYNAALLAGARTGHAPQCGRCGEAMKERSFPKAPDVPMYTCGKCKLVWLRDGQAEALQAAVAPDSLKPRWAQAAEERAEVAAAVAEEEDDEPAVYAVRGHGPLGLWPERMELQPWASWFVCGMPLWLAPLLVALVGLANMARYASDPLTQQFAVVGLVVPFIMWPVQTIFLAMALHMTWTFTYDSPGHGFGETLVLLLRVVPVVMLAGTIGTLIITASGSWLIGRLVQFILALTIYRRVMELEWRDIYILSIVTQILAGYITLALLTALAAAFGVA